MKKLIVISLIMLFAPMAKSQQQLVFTNYLLNEYYYNPALAGSDNIHRANVGYRNQWTGFSGSPSSLHANFYGSYKNERQHGYGASLVSERSGLVQSINMHLNYAYHLNINDSLRLGFGVRPGFLQYNINLYDAQLADAGDDVLTGNVLSTNALDLGAGLYLYHRKFFVSLSMRHIMGDAIAFTGFNDGLSKHFNLIGGYRFIRKENLKKQQKEIIFEPSILFQYVKPAPPQASIMLKTTYNKKFWGGLIIRTQDALGIVAGMNLFNRWSVGYAYDYSLGNISGYHFGSHELMISFIITKNRPSLDEEDEELNNSIFDENKNKNEE